MILIRHRFIGMISDRNKTTLNQPVQVTEAIIGLYMKKSLNTFNFRDKTKSRSKLQPLFFLIRGDNLEFSPKSYFRSEGDLRKVYFRDEL